MSLALLSAVQSNNVTQLKFLMWTFLILCSRRTSRETTFDSLSSTWRWEQWRKTKPLFPSAVGQHPRRIVRLKGRVKRFFELKWPEPPPLTGGSSLREEKGQRSFHWPKIGLRDLTIWPVKEAAGFSRKLRNPNENDIFIHRRMDSYFEKPG